MGLWAIVPRGTVLDMKDLLKVALFLPVGLFVIPFMIAASTYREAHSPLRKVLATTGVVLFFAAMVGLGVFFGDGNSNCGYEWCQ